MSVSLNINDTQQPDDISSNNSICYKNEEDSLNCDMHIELSRCDSEPLPSTHRSNITLNSPMYKYNGKKKPLNILNSELNIQVDTINPLDLLDYDYEEAITSTNDHYNRVSYSGV